MSVSKIELSEKLDQRSLQSLFFNLKATVGQPVELGTSQVRHLGGQCAQVLVAAVRKWSADGIELSFEETESFVSIVRNLGLEDEIFLKGSER